MLAKLASSQDRQASLWALAAFNNYSRCRECRTAMADDRAIECLAALLAQPPPQGEDDDLPRACLLLSCLRDLAVHPALRKRTVSCRVVAAVKELVARWALFQLPLGGDGEGEMGPEAVQLGQAVLRLMAALSYQTDLVPNMQKGGTQTDARSQPPTHSPACPHSPPTKLPLAGLPLTQRPSMVWLSLSSSRQRACRTSSPRWPSTCCPPPMVGTP